MSILVEIIDWLQDKPTFWQEATYRIIHRNYFDEDDISDLIRICKTEVGLLKSKITPPNLNKLQHSIKISESFNKTISLSKIFDTKNINAIRDGSELTFSQNGLTVIYGDNGSGKSSYVSILKQVCNTRGDFPVISRSLFKTNNNETDQIAKVEYVIEGRDSQIVTWKNGIVSDNILKAIHVFDLLSARHYIEGEDEIAFIPSGLIILEKLASCCQQVEQKIRQEINNLNLTSFNYSFLISSTEGTEINKFLQGINENTKLDDLKIISQFTSEDEKRIKNLEEKILKLKANDPQTIINDNKQKISRYTSLKQKYEKIDQSLSTEKIKSTRDVVKEFIDLKKTSQIVSNRLFSGLPLHGIGSDVWKQLWESARNFYDNYNKEKKFPDTSVCPLCLQNLDDKAKQRFIDFEEFVNQDIQRKLDNTKKKYENEKLFYKKINFNFEDVQPIIEEINNDIVDFKQIHHNFINQNEKFRDKVLNEFENLEHLETLESPKFNETPIQILDKKITELKSINKKLQNVPVSDELSVIQEELADLKARKLLKQYRPKIAKEICRIKKINLLEKCIEKCNTRQITLFNNKLSEKYITQSLRKKFILELEKFGFKNVQVVLDTRGKRGRQYFYLELDPSYPSKANLKDILSEGEHRCISLASFLAEIDISEHKSGIVFDDPVSSLDHRWRNKIAERIVIEAKERQVIVFTHDIVFLMMLIEHAEKLGIPLDKKSLTRTKIETGIIIENLPWDALPVKKRISVLNSDVQELEKISREGTEEEYKEKVRVLYGKLRECWERLVEEVLLNKVVQRFGREIQTKRLRILYDITEQDYNIIEENMSKCSRYFWGHDNAGSVIEQLPTIDEVKSDLKVLKEYLKELRKRNRS